MKKSREKQKEPNKKEEFEYEFGGPKVIIFIMIASHLLLLFLWTSFKYFNGQLPSPLAMFEYLPHFKPSIFALELYGGFFLFQLITAYIVPG